MPVRVPGCSLCKWGPAFSLSSSFSPSWLQQGRRGHLAAAHYCCWAQEPHMRVNTSLSRHRWHSCQRPLDADGHKEKGTICQTPL